MWGEAMKRQIIPNNKAGSCYFRTSVIAPYRKAIIQLTNVCNLHCMHCFVSSIKTGEYLLYEDIENMISQFEKLKVIAVTLTGGEPFMHPDIIRIIELLRNNGIQVSLSTNATLISEKQIKKLLDFNDVHLKVSLDGFSSKTHGTFRGDKFCFEKTCETINLLGVNKLISGILVTPNSLTPLEEYIDLCRFAVDNQVSYVLMNPLSNFGRGNKSINSMAISQNMMESIRDMTRQFQESINMVYIRFPNKDMPLLGCESGRIIYIFTNGDVAICPYLVFAAKNPGSKYDPAEFIAGKVFEQDIDSRIDNLILKNNTIHEDNIICKSCDFSRDCGKGCPAAVIASGGDFMDIDQDVCPIMYTKRNPI